MQRFSPYYLLLAVFVLSASMVLSPFGASAGEAVQLSEALGGVKFGGHIHSLATNLDQEFQSGSSADSGAVDVNSVELGLTASPVKAVDANVTFLLEEPFPDGGTPGDNFSVDQAYVTIAGNSRALTEREGREGFDVSPWYATVGKQYLPFGTNIGYHTFDVVSEPQSLQLSETLESAIKVGYTPRSGLNAYAGIFSGDGGDFENGSTQDDDLDDYFAGFTASSQNGTLSVNWMNNLNNSIVLNSLAGAPQAQEVGGLNVYGSIERGSAQLQAAYVAALDEYTRTITGLTTGPVTGNPEPSATTVEATYNGLTKIMGRPVAGTLVYEQTDEWLDHPEDVYGLVLDVPVLKGVTGSVEYLKREYDRSFATRLDEERLVSFRVAVGFEELLGET